MCDEMDEVLCEIVGLLCCNDFKEGSRKAAVEVMSENEVRDSVSLVVLLPVSLSWPSLLAFFLWQPSKSCWKVETLFHSLFTLRSFFSQARVHSR